MLDKFIGYGMGLLKDTGKAIQILRDLPPIDGQVIQLDADGRTIPVTIRTPDDYDPHGTPHPVILTLPPGMSHAFTVRIDMAAWRKLTADQTYILICPRLTGPDVEPIAELFSSALFAWMDDNLNYDRERVNLVGASAGGAGLFPLALATPERFARCLAWPGGYQEKRGKTADFTRLRTIPFWIIVGEHDLPSVPSAAQTAERMRAAGCTVKLDIRNDSHILILDAAEIIPWLEGELPTSR